MRLAWLVLLLPFVFGGCVSFTTNGRPPPTSTTVVQPSGETTTVTH